MHRENVCCPVRGDSVSFRRDSPSISPVPPRNLHDVQPAHASFTHGVGGFEEVQTGGKVVMCPLGTALAPTQKRRGLTHSDALQTQERIVHNRANLPACLNIPNPWSALSFCLP